jgi:hypothetical protein
VSAAKEKRRRIDNFNAAAEGAKHGISAELASEIWRRVCDETSDLLDESVPRARFAQIAEEMRAGERSSRPMPGKQTLASAVQRPSAGSVSEPGKRTLTEAQQPWPNTPGVSVPGKRTLTEALLSRRADVAVPRHRDIHAGTAPSGAPMETDQNTPSTTSNARSVELPHRTALEPIFGRHLAHVQAFTGGATELAPYGARALATGNVIAFADNAPSLALAAHEVAHAVQNEQAGLTEPMAAGVVASHDSEAEAEAMAVASMVAVHGPDVRIPPITAAPAASVHLSPDAAEVPTLRLDKAKDVVRLRSLIANRRQPEIVELLEQNANPEHMYALHRAYGSMLVADIQGVLTESSYLAKARVYLGEQMLLDAKLQARGQGDLEAILGDLEKLPDVRALALVAGEVVPVAWAQPATATWLPANTTLAAVKQALHSRVGADDYYRAMRLLLGKAEHALAAQAAQAPHGQHLEGFTVTMSDLGAERVHASPLALSPVSHARVDLAEARIRDVDASGNWMADPRKSRTAALAMTDLSGNERQALSMRLRDRPLANSIGGGMLTADALEQDDATVIKKAIIDAQVVAAVQAQAARSVGLDVAMERAGALVRAARAELEALPPSAPEAERKEAQAELARLESMFFGPGSEVLAMTRATAQRSGDADGGVAAVGAQLRALGADNLTIGTEQLRAVPAGDGAALVATLRKTAAVDRMGAMQRAGLLDALSNGALKLTPDQREQVSALVWQGAQSTELGAPADGPHAGEKASAPANTSDAPIVMPPELTPPLLGLRPELVLALHDILDAMGRGAADQVLARLARMSDADQRIIYGEPRYRAKVAALPEGGDKSPERDFKQALRISEQSGARAALLRFPGPGGDGDVYQRVLLESMSARAADQDQARMRRAYVLVKQLGGRQTIANNPALLAKLTPAEHRDVEQLIGKGDAGLLGERDHLIDKPNDRETASQLIFGQPGLGGAAQGQGALAPETEAEFMYYRLRDAAHIRRGVAITDWLSTDGARADASVAEFMTLYQRVHGAGISRGDLAQLADLYHRALRSLDSYRAAADSIASTAAQIVGAAVATIVVMVASGGTLGPVAVGAMATVSAAASSAATGAALRMHSTLSSVLKDAGTGAIEGLTAAAGASLTARIVRGASVGLPAGRAAASIGAHAVGQASQAGAEIAAAVIDGALGGASGELFQTATDEATWDRGVAAAFAAMLSAIARGAAMGAAMGGAAGGTGQALGKLARSSGQASEHAVSRETGAVEHDHAHVTEHTSATAADSSISSAAPTKSNAVVEHGDFQARDFTGVDDPRLREIRNAAAASNYDVATKIQEILAGLHVDGVDIQFRAKSLKSILGKLQETEGMRISDIKDLSGVRINIGSISSPGFKQHSEIVDAIVDKLGIPSNLIKDYNANPNSWGYTGRVHLYYKDAQGIYTEIQVGSLELSNFIETRVKLPSGRQIEIHDLTGYKDTLYGIQIPESLQAEYSRLIAEIGRNNGAGRNISDNPELAAEIERFVSAVQHSVE